MITMALTKEIYLVLGLSLGFIIFALVAYRTKQKKSLDQRLSSVANSFISWLVMGANHQPEHLAMAETLFTERFSEAALDTYQLMGYLAKDVEMMRLLDSRVKQENAVPAIDYQLASLQEEYINKFVSLSPKVLASLIAHSTSPFLQISALKILSYSFSRKPDAALAPAIIESIQEICGKYPQLGRHEAVRKQILCTISLLEKIKEPLNLAS